MITLLKDPNNSDKLVLSATITTYIDRLLMTSLNDELDKVIRTAVVEEFSRRELKKELKRLGKAYVEKYIAEKVTELQPKKDGVLQRSSAEVAE